MTYITLEDPQPIARYLGCYHRIKKERVNNREVNVMEYDMTEFMKQCVESYITLAGGPDKVKLREVQTPVAVNPEKPGSKPHYGNALTPDELEALPGEEPGQLSHVAMSVVTKVLYRARLAHWNLLKAVAILATRFARWSQGCDRALNRTMSYINCAPDLVLRGWVGYRPDHTSVRLFSDAVLADDRPSMRSTTGGYLAMTGPNAWFPLGCKSKCQSAASHSTTECEIVAADDVAQT